MGRLKGIVKRKIALGTTLALLLGALLMGERGEGERLLAVVDITRSMNAQDVGRHSRLEAAKRFLQRLVERLPCGSRLGVGIFTHRETLLLWRPVEVCRHGPALREGIEAISWRSAWAMDSYIAEGLREALLTAEALRAKLLFLSDGDRYPPEQKIPPFPEGRGWLLGVGSPVPVPIPKFDRGGRRIVGFWRQRDLPVYFDPALRERLKARDPKRLVTTRLDEPFLRELARRSGLHYLPLEEGEAILQERTIEKSVRRWLLIMAFLAALALL